MQYSEQRVPYRSWCEVLQRWAVERADTPAFVGWFNAKTTQVLTHARLERRAQAIGAALRERGAAGERVLLCLRQGPEALAALLGCWCAGAVAVPVALPHGAAALERMAAIGGDAEAAFALTDADGMFLEGHAGMPRTWLDVRAVPDLQGAAPAAFEAGPHTLALLQYTSGSTATPKGVMLTHGQLLANQAHMTVGMGNHGGSVFVSWAPLYHDMGLIGMALAALYHGTTCHLLSPDEFVRRPLAWLQVLSDCGGTVTAAPDFAYRLCLERADDAALRRLDLSRVETLLSGAEPVRADTLERFAARFAACGLRHEAVFAGYGLAEASVYVSGCRPMGKLIEVDRGQLATGQAVAPAAGAPTSRLVPCGRAACDPLVRVVDAQRGCALPAGRVGEIWVHGSNVGSGYWRRADATAETFHARLADEPGGRAYLRTGDLGFVDGDGQLFVCGRTKELIIVRGRNLHPDDVAQAVEHCAPAFAARPVAAFGIDTAHGEELVVVASPRMGEAAPQALIDAVRGAVAAFTGVDAAAVLLVPGAQLARTTSGKTQHRQMRAAFLQQRLQPRAAWISERLCEPVAAAAAASANAPADGGALAALVAQTWAELLGLPAVAPERNVFELGANSILVASVHAVLEERLQRRFPVALMFDHPSAQALAARLSDEGGAGRDEGELRGERQRVRRAALTARQVRARGSHATEAGR